jgi:dihydrofolate reductase
VSQLTDAGLVDEYQLVLHGIALGRGRKLFDLRDRVRLALVKTRVFENGNVVLWYERAS